MRKYEPITPKIRQMLEKPLDPKTMDNDGALRLIAAVMESIRKDYVVGKTELLRKFGRGMTEAEFNELIKKQYVDYTTRMVRLYFGAMRAVRNDPYGFGTIVSPEDIFFEWDKEVEKNLSGRRVNLNHPDIKPRPILREKDYVAERSKSNSGNRELPFTKRHQLRY